MADQALLGQFQGANSNLSAIAKALTNAFVGNVRGTFTMAAASTKTITSSSVTSSSYIFLTPLNAAAATLQGSAKCLFPAAANGNFVVTTASGASAAGTELFAWTAG